MLEFTVTHDMQCSMDRFWELFMDPEFTRKLIITGLGFARCDVDPTQERGGKQYRNMYVEPKIDVPGPVAKLLGPKLGYTEHAHLDPDAGVWTFELRLSMLPERIKMGGKIRVEPVGDDRCRRTTDLWTDVKILGIGKMVERAAEKNLRDGFEKSAAWMNEQFRSST